MKINIKLIVIALCYVHLQSAEVMTESEQKKAMQFKQQKMQISTYAQARTAKSLVSSKQKRDMTYQEMMQIMGRSAGMIYEGILLQNRQMVKDGALSISGHRAPRHAPWLIMDKSQQEAFKEMLLIYDKALHDSADVILNIVDKKNWHQINKAFSDMTTNCITCHNGWKKEVVKRNFKESNTTFSIGHSHGPNPY